MAGLFIEEHNIEVSAVPIDTTGAAVTGDRYNLGMYRRIGWLISQGAWAGGTPAVTLAQYDAVTAGNTKAISFAYRYTKVALTGTTWTKTAVTADTFNLPAVANTMNYIEINADELDTSGGYIYAALNIATPGANADLICVTAYLLDARYGGQGNTQPPDPKV